MIPFCWIIEIGIVVGTAIQT